MVITSDNEVIMTKISLRTSVWTYYVYLFPTQGGSSFSEIVLRLCQFLVIKIFMIRYLECYGLLGHYLIIIIRVLLEFFKQVEQLMLILIY